MIKKLFRPFVLPALIVSALCWTSCSKPVVVEVTPTPNPAPAFTNLVISGDIKVNLVAGTTNQVDTVTQGVIVKTQVNKTLFISGAGIVNITVSDLDTLITNGNTSVVDSTSLLHLDHLIVVANGFSRINMNLTASDSLVVISNGVGPYTFSGSTPKYHLHTNGLAFVHSYGLIATNVIVGLYGVGKSQVYASNSITAYIAGAGIIYYKGNPPIVNPVFIAGIGMLVPQ